MANPLVQTTIGTADPNASPITVNDLIALLNQLIHSEILGSYIPYVMQHEAPGVDDQDKAWIELDTAGRPIAIKVWYAGTIGAWRRIYNGMIGEIRGYSGDPSIDFDHNAAGVYTVGKVGLQYDGWYLCNGLNGTPNLSNKFLLGANMDNAGPVDGYLGGWQASIIGPEGGAGLAYKTGGRFIDTLTNDKLPLLSNAQPGDDPGIWIYGKQAKEEADHPGTMYPLVDSHYANAIEGMNINLTAGVPGGVYGKNPPNAYWTTPPFVALGWIIFKGY